ncbi:hypothetical protein [Saccharopolyspora sp. NPDC002686]|uniref:helix-turn-helix transcriptional regulator n=1 Tax=Saccharopolyspora sp. NPDC002686 TaxID=3154541 RepID=UPI00332530E7
MSDVIADAIRAARKREGMTRAELAEAATVADGATQRFTAAVVGYIETGRRDAAGHRRRDVTVDELVDLAAALATTPLALLGEHAARFGVGRPPECPRCTSGTGALERAVRTDIKGLGELDGAEPSLAQTAYALAAAIDAGGGEDGKQIPALAKELRATLKVLTDARAAKQLPDGEGDLFDGLGEPD